MDSEYQWSLASSREITIQFESKWIDCTSFESSLKKEDLDIDSITSIVFVLPENCKFLLETTARFLAICNQLIVIKKEVTIDLSENTTSLQYLNRAGFFYHLDLDCALLIRPPSEGDECCLFWRRVKCF